MRCKECGKNLSESCFYIYFVNGYKNRYHVCKKCISLKAKLKYNKIKEIDKFQEYQESSQEEKQKLITPEWVIRNLKRFGNCYVRHIEKIDIHEAAILVGAMLSIRPSLKENDGYIIEIKK